MEEKEKAELDKQKNNRKERKASFFCLQGVLPLLHTRWRFFVLFFLHLREALKHDSVNHLVREGGHRRTSTSIATTQSHSRFLDNVTQKWRMRSISRVAASGYRL